MSEAVREQTEPAEKIDHTVYPFVVPVKFHNSTRPYSFGTDMEDCPETWLLRRLLTVCSLPIWPCKIIMSGTQGVNVIREDYHAAKGQS